MSLRIRWLELRVVTKRGLFGTKLQFADGLVVLHAGNSMGKSTCMQAILYALGLEGMLTAKRTPPFPSAMTQTIADDDEQSHAVLESSVLIEIENGRGDVLTIQRSVKSTTTKPDLVRTWLGPALTAPTKTYAQRDLYVHLEGAAKRPDGFHFVLTNFLGWRLPRVARHQQSPSPLYLECIFPLLLVEQKHGWAGIQSRMPTHYGIKEPGKRAIEFLLDLDQQRVEKLREDLDQRIAEIKSEWSVSTRACDTVARSVAGVVQGLPRAPVADWPPAVPPQIMITTDDGVKALGDVLDSARTELKKVSEEEIPRVEQVAADLSASLDQAQRDVLNAETYASRLLEEAQTDEAQIEALDTRLEALAEDLRHHKDLVRLRKLGSDMDFAAAKETCPTCGQHVDDNLVVQGETMSIDDNIVLLERQIATQRAMRADAERVMSFRTARLQAVRERLDELRASVRSHRRTLTSDGRAPSEAAIRARLQLEMKVKSLARAAEDADQAVERLTELAQKWREAHDARAAIPSGLSSDDGRKLAGLERSVSGQLHEYGFRSFPANEIEISRTMYRPVHDGFDLAPGFELSASDMIRLIWAFLNGMLELSRTESTNHPGLLILDEPRQHSTSPVSFATFLGRASGAKAAGQQVIVATSEEKVVLDKALLGTPHQMHSIHGRILKPLEQR